MLQNEEACVLEVRKYGSSQHVEEPREGFHNSLLTPPPSSWEEEDEAGTAQGLMAPRSQIHLCLPEATLLMNASVRGLDGTGRCCSMWNFSWGDTVPGSVLHLKLQKASSRG